MLQHKIRLLRQLCLSEKATLNCSRFHLSRSSRLDSSSRDTGFNSAELADVVALQVIEFLGVSNKYTSLGRKGPVVWLSSHQQGAEQKNKLCGTFPVCCFGSRFLPRAMPEKKVVNFYLFAPFESDLVLQ